mgnify:CR=1 FL=1
MTAAALLLSTYALVFALGLQSLNVNGGHYRAAFLTSLAIGGSNLVLFKLAPNASGLEIAAYLAGGPLGIVSAMRAHPYIVRLYRRRRT